MVNPISLFDEVGKGQHEASILTTFSVYLPFYEQVVLPRLLAAGCRTNVVLVDAGECRKAMASAALRPQRAGRAYALIPIAAGGAFHPKVLLLLGPRSGKLFVGSHNLTLSGFGHNREMTTCFSLGRTAANDPAQAARDVMTLIAEWVAPLIVESRKWIDEVQRLAPWIATAPPAPAGAPLVLGTTKNSPTLWAQVRPHLPDQVRRVSVVGAFFDRTLGFLTTVQRELAPRELVVGIDPATTDIPHTAPELLPGALFVDVSQLGGRTGYLHAKALVIEGNNGEEVLITGSANPSGPAWVAAGSSRNIEVVVVQRSIPGDSLARSLGLDHLTAEAPVSSEAWETVRTRIRTWATEPGAETGRVVIAIVTPEGYKVPLADLPQSAVERAIGHAANATDEIPLACDRGAEWLTVQVPDAESLNQIASLALHHASHECTYGIPYDPAEHRVKSESETQKALERALMNLKTSLPEVSGLLRLMDKALFQDLPERGIARPGGSRNAPPAAPEPAKPEHVPETLAADLTAPGVLRRRARYLSEDNLALLLDTLIHHLGHGLDTNVPRGGRTGQNTEDGIDPDDEPRPALDAPDPQQIAALCRRKIQTLLLRRLVPQVAKIFAAEDSALIAVYQGAGVLGLTKTLAHAQHVVPGLPEWERLVDPKDLGELVRRAAWGFCLPEIGIVARCLRDAQTAGAEEVSIMLGLLMWAAWSAGIDARWMPQAETERREMDARIRDRASLLWIAIAAAKDGQAEEYTRATLTGTCRLPELQAAYMWCDHHYGWGRAVGAIQRPAESIRLRRAAHPGDLAWMKTDAGVEVPTIVLHAWSGRVELVDPTRSGSVRKVHSDYAVLLEPSVGVPATGGAKHLQ